MCTKKNICKFCLVWSKLLKIFNYGVQVQFSSKLSFSITGIYLNIPAMRAHKVSIMTNLQSHNFTCQTTHCLKYTHKIFGILKTKKPSTFLAVIFRRVLYGQKLQQYQIYTITTSKPTD